MNGGMCLPLQVTSWTIKALLTLFRFFGMNSLVAGKVRPCPLLLHFIITTGLNHGLLMGVHTMSNNTTGLMMDGILLIGVIQTTQQGMLLLLIGMILEAQVAMLVKWINRILMTPP